MCSIMVDTGSGISERQFADSFSKTISRGPDDTRIIRKGSGIMGFHRLSIMGLTPEGMQPFLLGDDAVVCNGEIYGFMKLKKELERKYSFVSDSDCEILLPLWHEYGTDMFKMLDAEFALVLYDSASSSFIAARDPIGIRPLYYGYGEGDNIIFASEAKNLVVFVTQSSPSLLDTSIIRVSLFLTLQSIMHHLMYLMTWRQYQKT